MFYKINSGEKPQQTPTRSTFEKLTISLLIVLTILVLPSTSLQYDCSRTEYNRCVQIADPLVREAHLIFPDNLDDIDLVCRTWNKFVDCLKRYTDRCFSDQQRLQFNKAVENPIESVHQMCMQPPYQKEYLKYAPCIKSTITEKSHCGPQYSLLVEQVNQGEVISKTTLCCSHDRFKQCVLRETRRLCDRGVTNGQASVFANQIIDKALSFLQDQCSNYIPNSADCSYPSYHTPDSISYNDPISISTSPSEVYPWSTIHDVAPKEIQPSRVSPPKVSTISWLPSSSISSDSSTHFQDSSSTQFLGSRTRPASYGRSSSWAETPVNTQPGINSIYTHLETASTQSSRPDWATISSWNVVNQQNPGVRNPTGMEGNQRESGTNTNFNPGSLDNPYNKPLDGNKQNNPNPFKPMVTTQRPLIVTSSSTETWYPAAGNQIDNEVEEPNQQGWRKPKNSGVRGLKSVSLHSVTICALTLFYYVTV